MTLVRVGMAAEQDVLFLRGVSFVWHMTVMIAITILSSIFLSFSFVHGVRCVFFSTINLCHLVTKRTISLAISPSCC